MGFKPGEAEATCHTCGGVACQPHRRVVRGVIAEGCVDAFHDGHLMPSAQAWHDRPEAKRIRSQTGSAAIYAVAIIATVLLPAMFLAGKALASITYWTC